jgi:hypothetical protein
MPPSLSVARPGGSVRAMSVFQVTYEAHDSGPREIHAHRYVWHGPETVFLSDDGAEVERVTRVQSISCPPTE